MTEEKRREAVAMAAAFIPEALAMVIASYQLLEEEWSKKKRSHGDPAAFKEFHEACKVAIGQINLLIQAAIRLERELRKRDRERAEPDPELLAGLIEAGRKEIDNYERDYGEDPGGE